MCHDLADQDSFKYILLKPYLSYVSNDAIIVGAHSNCFYTYYCRCTLGLGLVADSAPLSTVVWLFIVGARNSGYC